MFFLTSAQRSERKNEKEPNGTERPTPRAERQNVPSFPRGSGRLDPNRTQSRMLTAIRLPGVILWNFKVFAHNAFSALISRGTRAKYRLPVVRVARFSNLAQPGPLIEALRRAQWGGNWQRRVRLRFSTCFGRAREVRTKSPSCRGSPRDSLLTHRQLSSRTLSQ